MKRYTWNTALPAHRDRAVFRLNDDTLEYVIAGTRILAAVAFLSLLAAGVGIIWTGDYRWTLTALLAAVVTVAAGWVGFIVFPNEEWREHDNADN